MPKESHTNGLASDLYQQTCFRAAAGDEFRPGGLTLTDELAGECGLQGGQRVLDLGCGVGATASFLAERWGVEAVGLDSSAEFVAEARARDPRVTWVHGDAHAVPYPDAHFDAVFCECFLSTLCDATQVLGEVRRLLRPEGCLAVTDMYLRSPETWTPAPGTVGAACLRGAAGRETTVASIEEAGFAVRVWRDRSDRLKGLVASLIFSYGSAAAFWSAATGGDDRLRESVEAARPGYYLLTATPRTRHL